jgi:DNA mismatch endonuclease (patch repair protein)
LAYIPKTRSDFWSKKFAANVARDLKVRKALRSSGWRTAIIWECQLKQPATLIHRLVRFLGPPAKPIRQVLPKGRTRRRQRKHPPVQKNKR